MNTYQEKKNNKVLIIQHSGAIGGSGISLRHIVESLITLKYEVELLLPTYLNDLAVWMSDLDCRVYRLDIPVLEFYNGGLNSVFSPYAFLDWIRISCVTEKVREIIRESDATTVIVNSMTLCWLGRIIRQEKRRSICFHRETYQRSILNLNKKIIIHYLKHYFDDVVFISKYDLEQTGRIEGKPCVIYDRVDQIKTEISKSIAKNKLGFLPGNKYILFLGGISSLKGTDFAISALEWLPEEYKLVIVGHKGYPRIRRLSEYSIKQVIRSLLNGEDFSTKCARLIRKKRLEDRILFFPPTIHTEVFYTACDAVVVANRLAHQSRGIYEAGMTHCAVVVPDYPNTAEFLTDGVNGWTFNPRNSCELAAVIRKAVCSPQKKLILQNNYRRSLQDHNLNTLYAEIEAMLNRK